MKRIILASTLLLSAAVLSAAEDSNVTFIGHDQVAKGGSVVTAPNLSITIAHRMGPGMVEVHDKETDTLYVLDGSATIVTGGTMVGGSVTGPGQHRGTDITGGKAQTLTKGDVMVIPAGVPHWFKEVPTSIDYYVVKVIAQDEQVTRMRAALAAPERAAENKARDASRKPVESVQFFGIKTGQTVVDMIAAGGWFTEVLSVAVGPSGKVYASNPPFLTQQDAETAMQKRLGVQAVHTSLDEAGVKDVDAVVTALNLHDIYNGFGDQPAGEPPAIEFVKGIYAALKPGGVLGVIDHVGIAGQDNKALHRMQLQQARDVLTKAGFRIEAESAILANPADDHTKAVFDPAIRGKTDQFMIRARKPG